MINTFKELSHYELSKFHFKVKKVNGATNEEKLKELKSVFTRFLTS